MAILRTPRRLKSLGSSAADHGDLPHAIEGTASLAAAAAELRLVAGVLLAVCLTADLYLDDSGITRVLVAPVFAFQAAAGATELVLALGARAIGDFDRFEIAVSAVDDFRGLHFPSFLRADTIVRSCITNSFMRQERCPMSCDMRAR